MGGWKVSDLGIGTGIPSRSLQGISDDVGAIVLMLMAGTEYIGGSLTAEVLQVRGLSSAPLLLLVDPCRWEVSKRDQKLFSHVVKAFCPTNIV